MKSIWLGLALIAVAAILIYVLSVFTPIMNNVNSHDFFRGFAVGVGLVFAVVAAVLFIKKARENNSGSADI